MAAGSGSLRSGGSARVRFAVDAGTSAGQDGGRIGLRGRRKFATRALLLQAGRKLFGERGLYESRVEDLAGLAGVAKGTVYLYFESKVELVGAVVETGFQDLERHVGAAVEDRRSLADIVGGIVEAHLEFFATNPDLMRIFHQVRGILKFHRPEWRPLRVPLDRHISHLAGLLARAPSRLRDRGSQRRELAAILFGAVSGASSVREALEIGPDADRWSRLLSRGLRPLALELARREAGGGGRRRRERRA